MNIKRKTLSLLLIVTLFISMVGVFHVDTTYAATKKIHLRKTTVSIVAGKIYQQKLYNKNGKVIGATKVKWKSLKTSVARINKKGKITAVKAGTAKMTAKYKGKTYRFTVKVKPRSYITSDKSSIVITEASTTTVTFTGHNGANYIYCDLSNSTTVSVKKIKSSKTTSTFEITPFKNGTVSLIGISEATDDEKKVSIKVDIGNNSISTDPSLLTVAVGETKDVTIRTDKGSPIRFTKNNSNIGCAWGEAINDTECKIEITGKKVGHSVLTISDIYRTSVKETVEINVVPNPDDYIRGICADLIKRNVIRNNQYYRSRREEPSSYRTYFDYIYHTTNKKEFGLETSYYYITPRKASTTKTTVAFDISSDGTISKINRVTCVIGDEPEGDYPNAPAYSYVLAASFDRTTYFAGEKLEWELITDDANKPGDFEELSSTADFALFECLRRCNTFIEDEYGITLPDIGIHGIF